jgi:hypothetical protein
VLPTILLVTLRWRHSSLTARVQAGRLVVHVGSNKSSEIQQEVQLQFPSPVRCTQKDAARCTVSMLRTFAWCCSFHNRTLPGSSFQLESRCSKLGIEDAVSSQSAQPRMKNQQTDVVQKAHRRLAHSDRFDRKERRLRQPYKCLSLQKRIRHIVTFKNIWTLLLLDFSPEITALYAPHPPSSPLPRRTPL